MSLYLTLKHVHILSVAVSLALFLFRGGLMLGNVRWRRHRLLLVVPHVVDTVLLGSAIALAWLLRQYPFVHHWLTVKVLALVLYIVLGSVALRHGRTRGVRAAFLGLAAITFLFIVSVARTHHPLGFLLWL